MPSMLETIKMASLQAVDASNPVNVLFGTISSASPLKVNVEQRFSLSSGFLTVAKHLTDYDVDMEIEGELKKVKVKNALKSGDEVILIRKEGGQKYVIVDRVG